MKIFRRGAFVSLIAVLSAGVAGVHAAPSGSEDPLKVCIAKAEGLESADAVTADVIAGLSDLKCVGGPWVEDLSGLSDATSLESLTIDGRNVKDVSPLGSLTSLRELRLTDSKVSDVKVLTGLEQLEVLDLSDSDRLDVGTIPGLKSLKRLTLEGMELEGFDDLPDISEFPNLEVLNVSRNHLSDVRQIADYPQVERLAALSQFIALPEVESGATEANPVVGVDGSPVHLKFDIARLGPHEPSEDVCADTSCSELIFAGATGYYEWSFENTGALGDQEVYFNGKIAVRIEGESTDLSDQPDAADASVNNSTRDIAFGVVAALVAVGLVAFAIIARKRRLSAPDRR